MSMEETVLCAALDQPLQTCPQALSTIYATHYRHVLCICQRFFRQPEDAEDAAAEVFLKLHRVLETRDEALPFRPWVSKVTGRHCIDKLRQRKLEKGACVDGTDLSEVPDHSTPSPLSQVLRWEEQLEVREQLIRLPERYKVPLVLRYYKQMSYSEIARALKRQLPTVKTMIFRAKEQLRRNLRREQSGKKLANRVPVRATGSLKEPSQMFAQDCSEEGLRAICEGLFVSQRDHGVHAGGAAGWEVTGCQRNEREERGYRDEGQRVAGFDIDQNCRKAARGCRGSQQAENHAG